MRRSVILSFFVLLAVCLPLSLRGQYYDWGREAGGIRWNQARTSFGRIIYPDYFEAGAARVRSYMDTVSPFITYGLSRRPVEMPVVLHTQNFVANGLVMWAPRRMELEVIPEINTHAEPWLKQLSVHEFRHAAQYGNLYGGVMKGLNFLIGQQSGLLSLALAPVWLLEGDAVMMETQASSFGRALQPSFTIEYRAYFAEGHPRFPTDKWFTDSYKNYIPDHYQLGYQMTAYGRERYGDDMWGNIFDYAARRPYTILTTRWALHKYYKTSVNKLARATFADLTEYWNSLPMEENTATILHTPVTSYTTYDTPMVVGGSVVLAFKKDFDRPNRIVEVDTRANTERVLARTGNVSTPPTLRDGRIYWTEYRSSTLWDQRVFSRAVSYDLSTKTKRVVRDRKNALFATPLPDGRLATVGYDYIIARYSLDFGGGGEKILFPETLSIHGLAYDDVTATFAFIGLGDSGMFIGSIDPWSGAVGEITAPSHVTVFNLRAGDGKLSFNSIASGKDEIHIYDLRERQEYRLTTSRYGSVSPSAPQPGGEYYMAAYTLDGYLLSKVDAAKASPDSLEKVYHSELPLNTINPPRRRWEIINIDTVAGMTEFPADLKVKRYRKAAHMFNVHSWAPFAFDPLQIISENTVDVHVGVTAMSQNLLSNTFGFVYWGNTRYGGLLKGQFGFYGLAPKFDVSFDYGSGKQLVYGLVPETSMPTSLKKHFDVDLAVSLPMTLSSGYHVRTLSPSADIMHVNALLYDSSRDNFHHGYQRVVYSLSYSDNVRLAKRDFLPRWGYRLKVSEVYAPFNSGFGNLISLYGRVFLPGLFRHHSLMLRGNLQKQNIDTYNFTYKELLPRGAQYRFITEEYAAFSADYQLPVWYPDIGINSIVQFTRIRVNLYYDYARVKLPIPMAAGRMHTLTSYGAEISFDAHPLRTPGNETALTVRIYKPSDRNGIVVGVSLILPL